jgi:hypothetical protein
VWDQHNEGVDMILVHERNRFYENLGYINIGLLIRTLHWCDYAKVFAGKAAA